MPKVRVRYHDCSGCSSGDDDPMAFCHRGCPGYVEVVREKILTLSSERVREIREGRFPRMEILEVIEERQLRTRGEELVACAVCGASRLLDSPCACGFF